MSLRYPRAWPFGTPDQWSRLRPHRLTRQGQQRSEGIIGNSLTLPRNCFTAPIVLGQGLGLRCADGSKQDVKPGAESR